MRLVQIMNKYVMVEVEKKKALMHVDGYKYVHGIEDDTKQSIIEKFSAFKRENEEEES